MTQSTSSVFSHLRACQQDNIDIFNVTVEIITTENDPVNLRLKEAMHIRKEKPQININTREECSELSDLLF